MERPPSHEHAQPSQVSAVENSGITDELRSTGGQGAKQVKNAGDASTDSSRREDDARLVHEEGKQQTDPTPEGHAATSSSQLGTELASCLKVLIGKNIFRHISEVETIKDEIASQRVDDPAQAESHTSVAEQRSTERSKSDDNSGTTLTTAEAAGTDSYTGDQALEKTATAESQSGEKQSEVRGRWSIWSQYISHELSMPVRRKPPPEGVGPPVSHTAVAQRLLQIFRERQETAQNIAGKSSEGSSAVMREMLPELRAPENRTLRECEEELAMSAATKTSRDSEIVPSQTCTGSCTKQLTEIMEPVASTPTDGAVEPSRHTSKFPGDFENTTSLSAATTSVERKGKLVSSSPANTKVHQHESPLPETVPHDSQDKQPQQRTMVPADLLALSPRMAAMLPDYHRGLSKRFHVGQSPLTLKQQSTSTYRNTISSLLMQPRASAFSAVRKILHENKPIPLALPPTSSLKVGDKNPEPTGKSEPTVVRKLDFSLDTSADKDQASASLQRLEKNNLSAGPDATDEVSPGQLPAYKRRVDETTRVGEPSDASDDSVSSPQDHFRECFFRAIELAPVSVTSGTKLWRPKPLRVPLTAQTVTTCIPKASDVSEQSELVTKMLASASSSSPGKTSAGNRDSPGSDANMSSLSSTTGDIKGQPEIEETSTVSKSDMPKNTEGKRGVTKAASEDILSESDLHDSKALDDQPGCNEAERSDTSSQRGSDDRKTSDSQPRGTDSAREDCHRAVDSERLNSPDDRLESKNAEHEDIPSGSALDVSEAVDDACEGTTAECKNPLLGSDLYASESGHDQHRGTENEIECTATVGESLDRAIRDEVIRSAEEEHADSPLEVDSESSNNAEDKVGSGNAEREGTPGSNSDNLETADGERKGIKTDRNDTSEGNNPEGLKTVSGGCSPMESAQNKSAPSSTKGVAGHYQPKLEERQASCTGSGVLAAWPLEHLPESQVDKFGYTSDQSSNVSSPATGSDNSYDSDCVALIVDSISDDEITPENMESSEDGADDVRS